MRRPTRTRVAIIEDSEDVQVLLAAMLEHDGFEVTTVSTSIGDGIPAVLADPPDVVLLDEHLGDGSGHSAIPLLHAGGLDAEVVVLTGYASPRTSQLALAAGAAACLDKSIARHLGAVLRQLVGARTDGRAVALTA